MKRTISRLPDAELEVMQALWSFPRCATRAQLEGKLHTTHPMAPTTLLTLLTRLGEKGFVNAEKQGRTVYYSPLIPQKDYLASQSSRFIRKLCGGNLKTFANALCDSGLSKEDLQQLRQLLERDDL